MNRLLTDVALVSMHPLRTLNGEFATEESLAPLLTFEERRQSRKKVIASHNHILCYGGYGGMSRVSLKQARNVILISVIGPQFSEAGLDDVTFIRNRSRRKEETKEEKEKRRRILMMIIIVGSC